MLNMHLAEANLLLLLVTDIIVRGRLDANHSVLILGEVIVAGCERRQGEVTVEVTTPAPVDVELTILIAMEHEGMTLLVLESAIDDGTAQLDLVIEGLFPFLVGELFAVYQINALTEVKDGDEGTGDTRRTGSRLICFIVHQHRLSAVAHQPGNVVVGHVEPVELAGWQRRKVYLFFCVIFVRGIADGLSHAVQWPLEEVHHLGHCRGDTTGKRLGTINIRALILVDTILIPFGFQQWNQFCALTGTPGPCTTARGRRLFQ